MSWKRSQARWEGEWHPAHTAHFYVKNMATMVCPLLVIVYQIKGLTSWWDAQEYKEGLLTFFKTQFHLSEYEHDLEEVSGFFREREIHRVVISEEPNPMVIPRQFQGYNRTKGRLCQWDRCYPWKSFLLFLGSIWAFYVTKWWQIKDDSICNLHEHLNWVMYYKKYAWKGTPILKVYRYIIKICAH